MIKLMMLKNNDIIVRNNDLRIHITLAKERINNVLYNFSSKNSKYYLYTHVLIIDIQI